jgi:hypothetical protein
MTKLQERLGEESSPPLRDLTRREQTLRWARHQVLSIFQDVKGQERGRAAGPEGASTASLPRTAEVATTSALASH